MLHFLLHSIPPLKKDHGSRFSKKVTQWSKTVIRANNHYASTGTVFVFIWGTESSNLCFSHHTNAAEPQTMLKVWLTGAQVFTSVLSRTSREETFHTFGRFTNKMWHKSHGRFNVFKKRGGKSKSISIVSPLRAAFAFWDIYKLCPWRSNIHKHTHYSRGMTFPPFCDFLWYDLWNLPW